MCVNGSITYWDSRTLLSTSRSLPSSRRHRDGPSAPTRWGAVNSAATAAVALSRAHRRQGRVAHAGSPQSGRAARRSGRAGWRRRGWGVGPRRQSVHKLDAADPASLGGGATARRRARHGPRAGARGGSEAAEVRMAARAPRRCLRQRRRRRTARAEGGSRAARGRRRRRRRHPRRRCRRGRRCRPPCFHGGDALRPSPSS